MATTDTTGEGVREPGTHWPQLRSSVLRLSAVRITVVYLVLGLVALVFFDIVLVSYLGDPTLREIQALKGGVEVLLTAALIFWLTSSREAQLRTVTARVNRDRRKLAVLHRVLRHNLRNDINVILAATDLLENRIETVEAPEESKRIERVCERMEAYTDYARRIRKVDDGPDDPEAFDVVSIIEDLVDTGRVAVDPAAVSLALPESRRVRGNYMLPGAIESLLTDVLVPHDDGTPRLSVSVDDGPGGPATVQISIRGRNLSIPRADREAIERGNEDDLVHASGLSAWFVAWTIERSDGELEFVDHEDGTEIRVSLPRAH